jgi:hypothetical protein
MYNDSMYRVPNFRGSSSKFIRGSQTHNRCRSALNAPLPEPANGDSLNDSYRPEESAAVDIVGYTLPNKLSSNQDDKLDTGNNAQQIG